ncbi:MAG: ABC transporter ATP-binding protein [Firmicutes bacterium]|nr:ABC transporter ATP-binding protein [Bacillota bacterium]
MKLQANAEPAKNYSVIAKDLGIKYLAGRKGEDLKSLVLNPRVRSGVFWALRQVDFSCFAGDVVGIIGSNGAGKTTLCRVISNLLRPDEGSMTVKGEVSALLSMGTGFNHGLSGKDNIFLNGMMLGFSKKEITKMYDDIVEFSGLHEFINQPIKKYSSGMRSRLGFSIATMLNPEILVLDEALSTGDADFKARAMQKTKELVANAKIVIIVSHNIDFIAKNCSKAVWIDRGRVMAHGEPAEVCDKYRAMVAEKRLKKPPKRLRLRKTETLPGDEIVIEAKDLGLKYNLDGKDFWALRHCNLAVKEGDILGVIGHNGAGKSTLCKLISEILKPDEGSISVKGNINALLSLGSGFNRQLSGRDNIFLNGLLLGIPKKELEYLYDDIVEFSGLEKSIHLPVKNYSSGMVSRLGFSIAAMLEPDIFIIDEALSAGDMSFYERASERIQEMVKSAKAVVIVTHSMKFVQNVCTRAVWMKQGNIIQEGNPGEIIEMYRQDVRQARAKMK